MSDGNDDDYIISSVNNNVSMISIFFHAPASETSLAYA
jgi:hypothetical protein